jgi:hypothetical protein
MPNEIMGADKTFIYFVRSGEFIKIGQSKRWKERVMNMQVGSPHTIIVLLVLVAEPSMEGKLHNWFRTDHYRGEWFHSGPAILAYIKEHLPQCVAKTGKCDLRTPKPAKDLAADWEDAFA